jgi:hypothetical protein
MTFLEIQNRALDELGFDSTQASSTARTRIKARINDIYRAILRKPDFRLLRDISKYTLASVATTPIYGMPISVGRINALTETDNDRKLEMRTLDWLRSVDPGQAASGTPDVWIPMAWYPVQTQPLDASTVVCRSSSAADTTQTAYIEYMDSAGVRRTNSVTLNGVTARTLTNTTCVEITKFYLSAVAAGTVEVLEDDISGQVLLTLPIGYKSSRYFHIRLWPTPASAITYTVDATRELADLAQDTEEPILPYDFHDMLWRGAVRDEWLRKDDDRARDYNALYEQAYTDLKNWVWNQVDYLPSPSDSSRAAQTSRLGSWFPSGT